MAEFNTKHLTGGSVTDGKEGTACSAGLKEPVVKLVDLASTSGKQGRMERPVAPVKKWRRVRAQECSDDGDESDSSIISTMSTASERTSRKRGRPPTTGEYVGLAEAKQRLLDLTQQQERAVAEDRILDRNFAIDSTDRNMRADDDVAQELRNESSSGLAAIIDEDMMTVRKAAKMSSNMKGTIQKALKESAQRTRLAALEMAKRQGGGSERTAALENENKRLRTEVEDLKEQVRSLSAQVERLLSARVESLEVEGYGQETMMVSTAPECSIPTTEPVPCPPSSSPAAGGTVAAAQGNELLDQIAVMIDRKLALFYLELHPEVAARPPLGAKEVEKPAPASSGTPGVRAAKESEKKGKRKTGKATKPSPVTSTAGQAAPAAGTAASSGHQCATPAKQAEAAWSKVVGRKAARKAAEDAAKPKTAKAVPAEASAAKAAAKAEKKKTPPPRVPKAAAVTITVPEGCTTSYADAMKTVRQKVKLEDIGIGQVRPKRAITGGLILEVPGPEGSEKAKALAERMSVALDGTGVKVAQPTKQAEIRVRGLDDSATPDEVAAALASAGGCKVGDIKIGEIRRSPTGLGTVWVRCPAAVARKVVVSGRLLVGWVAAKVEALEARPLQCHRCLEMGHVRQRCTAAVDRSALCYNCGAPGHRAGQCPATSPRCALCADAGKPADHRMGSRKCTPSKKGKRAMVAKQGPTATTSTSGPKPSGVKKIQEKPAGKAAQGGSGLEEAMETN